MYCICHINQERELLIDIRIAPGKSKVFQTIPALLDSRANATVIDTAVAERLGYLLKNSLTPFRCSMWMEHGTLQETYHMLSTSP